VRYFIFFYCAIFFFILSLITFTQIERSFRFLLLGTFFFIFSVLFFKLKDRTIKEMFLNLKKDLKLDGDYI